MAGLTTPCGWSSTLRRPGAGAKRVRRGSGQRHTIPGPAGDPRRSVQPGPRAALVDCAANGPDVAGETGKGVSRTQARIPDIPDESPTCSIIYSREGSKWAESGVNSELLFEQTKCLLSTDATQLQALCLECSPSLLRLPTRVVRPINRPSFRSVRARRSRWLAASTTPEEHEPRKCGRTGDSWTPETSHTLTLPNLRLFGRAR